MMSSAEYVAAIDSHRRILLNCIDISMFDDIKKVLHVLSIAKTAIIKTGSIGPAQKAIKRAVELEVKINLRKTR